MEEFLIIAPEGWAQYDYEYLINSGTISIYIKEIETDAYQVTNLLTEAGVLINNEQVLECKIINDKFMWLKLG